MYNITITWKGLKFLINYTLKVLNRYTIYGDFVLYSKMKSIILLLETEID
jgi:hypothetical protein